jgi:hypothetical protein
MLAIADTANNNGVPGLNTDFLVAALEMLDDSSCRVWFTRPFVNGTNTANYTIQGPATRSIVLAQYETDTRGVRLYFDSALSVGQWTLGLVSGSAGTLISNDSDALYLPTSSQIVFDLVDLSTNDGLSESVPLGDISRSIPKKFRSKPVFAALIAALEAGDQIVSTQARAAFDQMFLSSATGSFLTTRAADRGIIKPSNLGISDETFRTLAIKVINNKLTGNAMLSILEAMFGFDSVHAFVESTTGPYTTFDGGTIDLLLDGVQQFQFISDWADYQNPLRATVQELVADFNFQFQKHSINAIATVDHSKIRIYSLKKGAKSTISVTGGTLQPHLQFGTPIFTADDVASTITWTITNPRERIVRLAPTPAADLLFSQPLKAGDYVTIIGSEFPEELRGSFPVVDVNLTYSGSTAVEWFEIESDYIVT